MRLETVLVERGVVTQDELRRATTQAASTSTTVRDVLIRDGVVTDEQISWHLADAHGLPFVHLTSDMIDPQLVLRAGSALLHDRCAIPMQALWGEVTLAVADPADGGDVEDLREALGGDLELHIAVAQQTKIRYLLNEVFGASYEDTSADTQALDDPAGVATFYGHVVRAISHGASVVRFDTTVRGLVVRAEIDGRLRTVDRLPKNTGYAVASRARLLLDGASEGTLETVLFGTDTALGIQIVPTREAEAVVVNLGRPDRQDRRPLAVRLGGEGADRARELVLSGPIVLVAGPDAAARSSLARALVEACGVETAPLAAVAGADADLPTDCIPLALEHLDHVAALRPRLLLVDDEEFGIERLRDLAAIVPSIVLVRSAVSAATAISLCPPEVEPLIRAAVGPDGSMEAPWWI